MRFSRRLVIMFLLLFHPLAFAQPAEDLSLPLVVANDNRTPAGKSTNGVLNLQLELRQARWYAEDEKAGYRDVYAFAEQGQLPQSSGPLIRVPRGTIIHATVRNTLPSPAKIHGLHSHPGNPNDTVNLAPNETRELRFLAGEPGTYTYWATTSGKPLEGRNGAESMLFGAFVIDPEGAKPDDRIFVLGIWTKNAEAEIEQQIPSINGKSWPYSEHLTYKVGQTAHWRVINPTSTEHAMHLHGFYFTVDAVGDGEHYERYPEGQRRLGVTEHIGVGHVFEMTWTPQRAGNWLFHCHMMAHMSQPKELHPNAAQAMAYAPPGHDPSGGMGGLVLGITVLPGTTSVPVPATTKAPRRLQLVISVNPEKVPLYKLEVSDPLLSPHSGKDKPPALLGPPILLTRGEATEIEVKNLTGDPTAIHWHGIELESYYDGVAGWTGSGQQRTPAIAPGSSFVARMTPPRAGTFIYHTHWHDEAQLLNGMYGPLIVLEPGQKYDPEHDRTFVFSTGRYAPFDLMLLVNGTPQPDPLVLHTGTRYRLRLINITRNDMDLRVRLTRKDMPVQWKVVAKDGADLPPAQLKSSTAEMGVPVGSTCDVEYQAESEGHLDLEVYVAGFQALTMQPFTFIPAE
jgi:FtsP/CotA-like multicopper oxidase with cupredoxin domain